MTKETQVIIYVIEVTDEYGNSLHRFLTDDKKQAFQVRSKASGYFIGYRVHCWTM